ncbi:MAG: hypothetical protein UZ17_ACD001001734 [Acidobacteria bacterium OLB17]|nr:MAG: hypothetical protein UZ17_ACD001001734 [Acidobacteria bacterium OLB17]
MVLVAVAASQELVPLRLRVELYAGVVPGRDLLAADRDGHPVERGELQPRVARNARDRRLARKICCNEGLDDIAVEILLKIQNVEREAQLLRNSTRVVNVVERAAA